MNNIISVITPVHVARAEYLGEAYDSLNSQVLPEGWELEWIVQEDGLTGKIAAVLPDDPRISSGSGRPGGPGTARTLALSRAQGRLVKVLDADDLLTSGTLARDIMTMTAHPRIGWTTARALDLRPDGSVVSFEKDDPDEGYLARGTLLSRWEEDGHRAPVHPATLCLRRELLLALGGWMALPASEDTGLLLAANALADGYFIATPGLLYRKWPGQSTSEAAHTDSTERDARMSVIAARARALLNLFSPPAVDGPG